MASEVHEDVSIQSNVPLRDYTTFHIGGPAEYFAAVTSVPQLKRAVAWARGRGLPITILGGGSNVLVGDGGVRGLVIHNIIVGRNVTEDGDSILLTVGAGEVFDKIVAYAAVGGWWGLENLSCIPGSVGATPIQNIGAYGVEIRDCLAFVEAYDMQTNSCVRLASEECAFGYRDSLFKRAEGKRYIVTHVAYRLTKTRNPVLHYRDLAAWHEAHQSGGPPRLEEIRAAVCAIRSRKFPDWNIVGTAGSFFKNPVISETHFNELLHTYPLLPGYRNTDGSVKIPLGWILDNVLAVR
ncbi:MAG: UDP-N-acetylmuramate dehydrogenase, partial [Patescibacteria group bacterium]|nr:UDP-N-acetylmuramate dehydrogenase [Patescibacteria group bacterium]